MFLFLFLFLFYFCFCFVFVLFLFKPLLSFTKNIYFHHLMRFHPPAIIHPSSYIYTHNLLLLGYHHDIMCAHTPDHMDRPIPHYTGNTETFGTHRHVRSLPSTESHQASFQDTAKISLANTYYTLLVRYVISRNHGDHEQIYLGKYRIALSYYHPMRSLYY